MRKSLSPFSHNPQAPEKKSLGGARPIVQMTAQAIAGSGVPMLAARIYAPPAMKHYDDSDPRFAGKADNVENIYLPPPPEAKPRSGFLQAMNWLFTGKME